MEGVTVADPERPTGPMPLLITTVLAFVDVQVRVAVCPAVRKDGLAVRETLGLPDWAGVTVTVTVAWRFPPEAVATAV